MLNSTHRTVDWKCHCFHAQSQPLHKVHVLGEVTYEQAPVQRCPHISGYPTHLPFLFIRGLLCKGIFCSLYLYEVSCYISVIPRTERQSRRLPTALELQELQRVLWLLVCEQLCSRRGKRFCLPRVAKSLELALVISVTSLKPVLSHFKCKGKEVQWSQLNSCR